MAVLVTFQMHYLRPKISLHSCLSCLIILYPIKNTIKVNSPCIVCSAPHAVNGVDYSAPNCDW